jgi:hypothetical protein
MLEVTIDGNKLDPVINYDIIPVQVNVKGILRFESEVLITDSKGYILMLKIY